MKKRNKQDSKALAKSVLFQPATAEQITQLEVLRREALYLYTFLNRPKGIFISAIGLPILFHFLFFRENAWFIDAYANFLVDTPEADTVISDLKQIAQGIEHDAGSRFQPIVSFTNDFEKKVQTFCQSKGAKNPEQCYDLPNIDYAIKNIAIKHVKKNCPKNFLNIMKQLNLQTKTSEGIRYAIRNMMDLCLRYVLDDVQQGLSTHYEPVLENLSQNTYSLSCKLFNTNQIAMLVVSFLCQQFLLDPLLLRLSPEHNVIAQYSIEPYIRYQKGFAEANQAIIELKERQEPLKERVKRQKKIARLAVTFLLFIPTIYNLFLEPGEIGSALSLCFFMTLAIASKDGWQDFRDRQKSRELESKLATYTNWLNAITKCMIYARWGKKSGKRNAVIEYKTAPRWELNPGKRLETSYFSIELEGYKSLTARFIARKLEYYLHQKRVEIHHSRTNSVIIAAPAHLEQKDAIHLAKQFREALERFDRIQALRRQCSALVRQLKQSIIIEMMDVPYQDKADLPATRIHLIIAAQETFLKVAGIIIRAMEEQKPGNQCIVEQNSLIIQGFHPFTEEALKEVKSSLESFIKENKPSPQEVDSYQPRVSSMQQPRRKSNKKREAAPPAQAESQEDQSPVAEEKIYWGNHCFDPDDKQCPVQRMRPDLLSRGRHFVVFELKPEHFPPGYPPTLCQDLEQKCLQGKIGAEKQGWQFVSALPKNDLTTGEKSVNMSAKFRIFGEFGDMRLYARSTTVQTASGDKILHRVVGLDPHAHRG